MITLKNVHTGDTLTGKLIEKSEAMTSRNVIRLTWEIECTNGKHTVTSFQGWCEVSA